MSIFGDIYLGTRKFTFALLSIYAVLLYGLHVSNYLRFLFFFSFLSLVLRCLCIFLNLQRGFEHIGAKAASVLPSLQGRYT